MDHIGEMPDVFRRSLLWGSLWDSVRQADLAPRDYVGLAAKQLPGERDESLTQSILSRAITALHRYVGDDARHELSPAFETIAANQMTQSPEPGLRIVWFRGFVRLAETPAGLAKLSALLSGQVSAPGIDLRPLDRWNMLTALIASGDPEADDALVAEKQHDGSGDAEEYAYVAQAARPDAATKQKYFDDYLHGASRPEDWVEQSLGAFNYWNQSKLTAPYLQSGARGPAANQARPQNLLSGGLVGRFPWGPAIASRAGTGLRIFEDGENRSGFAAENSAGG